MKSSFYKIDLVDDYLITTSESTIGEFIIGSKDGVLPCVNLSVMENSDPILTELSSQYIDYAYIYFKSLDYIRWYQEQAQELEPGSQPDDDPRMDWYGGVYFNDRNGEMNEFFVRCKHAYLILPSDFRAKESMWRVPKNQPNPFSAVSLDLVRSLTQFIDET